MQNNIIPLEEINNRINVFQEYMSRNELDGALIMQSTHLYYFSGIFQTSFLFVPVEGEPLLMVRRSKEQVEKYCTINNRVEIKSIKQVPSVLNDYGYNINKLGIEADVIPAASYFNIQKLFPGVDLADCSKIIKQMRAIKSPYEIELLQDTGNMLDKVFSSIPEFLYSGAGENEVAGELEGRLRKEGHQGLIRLRGLNNQDFHYGCILSGPNGAVPSFFDGPLGGTGLSPGFPFGAGYRKVEKNEPVIVDYVGAKNGYLVDMTRVFVIGELDSELEKAHNVALEIQNELIDTIKPGIMGNEAYDRAVEIVTQNNLQDFFMGAEEKVAFIAHGVGLELNELPIVGRGLEVPLKEGMVIALEPKFIFPGEGAVGIENTFVITSSGLKRISNHKDEVVIIH